MKSKNKCVDCIGFCNFGKYPICKPSVEKEFEDEILLCKNCGCMTHTKKGYIYICGKCGKDRRRNGNNT